MPNPDSSSTITARPVQTTLTDDTVDQTTRTRPSTMLWCETTEQFVLRRHRDEWPYELQEVAEKESDDAYDALPDDCQFLTQTFQVEFVYEYREVVTVEATAGWDAKERASDINLQNPEYMDTLHTEVREVDDPSQASMDYLRDCNLLPEEYDDE